MKEVREIAKECVSAIRAFVFFRGDEDGAEVFTGALLTIMIGAMALLVIGLIIDMAS